MRPDYTKPASRSLTIQSATVTALVTLILFVSTVLGFEVSESELYLAITSGTAFVGAVVAIIGRLRATKTIE